MRARERLDRRFGGGVEGRFLTAEEGDDLRLGIGDCLLDVGFDQGREAVAGEGIGDGRRDRIVDAALFDAVAARARNRPNARLGAKHPWPLNGALRCVCGLRITGRISGSGSYRKRYYICPDPATHDGYPGHRAADLEEQFAALLQRLGSDPSVIEGYEPPDADLDALGRQKAVLGHDLAALDDRRRKAWALAEDGGIDAGELRARIDELNAARERLQESSARIAGELQAANDRARSLAEIREALGDAAKSWAIAEVERRQWIAMAVAALVGGIYVEPDRRHVLNVGPAPGEFGRKVETFCTIAPWQMLRERLAAVETPEASRRR